MPFGLITFFQISELKQVPTKAKSKLVEYHKILSGIDDVIAQKQVEVIEALLFNSFVSFFSVFSFVRILLTLLLPLKLCHRSMSI